ncbi:ATPase/permease component of an ABC superfamily multidrug transporter [Lacticaseibacillus paracasei]|nr:ATPase/permease component of an ABC superfamily multidrug transporter [Lacticaseibacillus paracasei]
MINLNGRRGPRNLHPEKVTLVDWKQTVRRIWGYLDTDRRKLLIVFGLTLFTTLATIVGNRVNGIVVDQFITKGRLRELFIVSGLLAGMYFLSSIFTYFQTSITTKVAQRTSAAIRHDLFAKMQRLPMRYFDTHDNGDIMSRLTNDVDNINTALMQTFVQLYTGIISVVGMGIAMLLLSPLLTGIVVLASVATFFYSRTAARITQKAFTIQQQELGSLNTQIEENVSGKQLVQLFDHQQDTIDRFNETNARYTAAAYRAQLFSGVIGPFNNMTNNFAYLLITFAGALAILRGGTSITVGVIFTFLIYLRNFTGPINNILNLINTLQLSLASAERVFQVVDADPEKDAPNAVELDHTAGNVKFDHVSFAYDGKTEVLHDISFTAHQGEVVAIVGPTGAGKTTIMNLLTDLYPLTSGSITLDDHDVTQITFASLRRLVTVVQQESFLFTATIRENIRMGRPDATDAEVETAAKAANADGFINQLPDGYDTMLSENASRLSQGQRQLLSIARAFAAQAPVLVLDEATASIDSNTETDVQHAMNRLMQQHTSFVIAHRLSTIRNASKILVIDQGKLIESGTHEQLLAAGGFYAKLYNSPLADMDKMKR